MPEELLEEQLTKPAPQETASEEQPSEPEQTEPTSQEPPKEPKKRRELLLPFLTVLLIVLGISEAVFWGYFGFSSYQHSLAVERYEAQQKALEEERASNGIVGGSAYGPNLKVENGTITWQREGWVSAGSSTSAGGPVSAQEETKRLSSLSVPIIPYTLAEADANGAQEPAPEDVEDGTAPAST